MYFFFYESDSTHRTLDCPQLFIQYVGINPQYPKAIFPQFMNWKLHNHNAILKSNIPLISKLQSLDIADCLETHLSKQKSRQNVPHTETREKTSRKLILQNGPQFDKTAKTKIRAEFDYTERNQNRRKNDCMPNVFCVVKNDLSNLSKCFSNALNGALFFRSLNANKSSTLCKLG